MRPLKVGFVTAFLATGIGIIGTLPGTTGCSDASQVGQIFMALDGEGQRPRDTFYPDTTSIFCDVVWNGRNPDTTIDAFIVQTKGEDPPYSGSGALVGVSNLFAVGEAVGGEELSILSFAWQITGDGGQLPFPVGSYECQVQVNGQPAGSQPFYITYPGCQKTDPNTCGGAGTDCPLGAATPGAPCLGIYHVNAQCPSLANFSKQDACTCDGTSGVWQCQ